MKLVNKTNTIRYDTNTMEYDELIIKICSCAFAAVFIQCWHYHAGCNSQSDVRADMTYGNSKLSYHFYEGTRIDISPRNFHRF